MALGSVAGGKLFGNLKELPPSMVLAISDSKVYVFGRDRIGIAGGWGKIVPMGEFERRCLRVDTHQHAAFVDITLTDTDHDVSLELEANGSAASTSRPCWHNSPAEPRQTSTRKAGRRRPPLDSGHAARTADRVARGERTRRPRNGHAHGAEPLARLGR